MYESFFSNVPVILTEYNIGVNRDHINRYTGILSDDDHLGENIEYMLKNFYTFSPRKWALENTGYSNPSKKLNEFIKKLAINSDENWTKDIYAKMNFTNAIYINEEDRQEADQEVQKLANISETIDQLKSAKNYC